MNLLEPNKRYSFNSSYSGCDIVATINIPNENGTYEPYVIGELQTITYSIHMDKKPVRSLGNMNAKDYVLGPRTIAGTLIFSVFDSHFAYRIMQKIRNKHPQLSSAQHFLADELMPFDITLSFANETGMQSRLAIYGVRLINEGQTMSVNDIYTENTYQFVAIDIDYLDSLNNEKTESSQSSVNATSTTATEKLKSSDVANLPLVDQTKYTLNCTREGNTDIYKFTISPPLKSTSSGAVLKLFDLNGVYIENSKRELNSNPFVSNLSPGKYVAQVSLGSKVLCKTTFIVEG